MKQTRHSSEGRAHSRNSNAHWAKVWERLKAEGRVDVENPESTRNPTCRSGSSALNWASNYLPDPAWGDIREVL